MTFKVLCFHLLVFFSSCQQESASPKSFHDQVDDFMISYVEQIGAKVERIQNQNLKEDITILLDQLLPGLKEIFKLNKLSKKMKLVKTILPELQNIEILLNHINQESYHKMYRNEEDNISPIDAALLLTVYEQIEQNESSEELESNNPPWYPRESSQTTSTNKSPYKV